MWILNFSFFLAHHESLIHICAYLEDFHIIFFTVKNILLFWLFLADTRNSMLLFYNCVRFSCIKAWILFSNLLLWFLLYPNTPLNFTILFLFVLFCQLKLLQTKPCLQLPNMSLRNRDEDIIVRTLPSTEPRVDSHKEFKLWEILNTDQ